MPVGRNRHNGNLGPAATCRLVLPAALLLAACCACGGPPAPISANPDASESDSGDSVVVAQDGLSTILRRPFDVNRQYPQQSPQMFASGRYYYGAYAVEQGQTRNASAEQETAIFAPDWRDGAGEAASVIFTCNLENYEGPATIGLEWASPALAASNAFAGWGNLTTNAWDWNFPGQPAATGSIAPYLDEDSRALVAIVVLGDTPLRLNGIRIGDEVIREGVDMSQLFAPVMAFEIEGAAAELAARSPVDRGYYYVDVYADGPMKMAVVSHTVEGLTHYGSLRIPPESGPGTIPIMLLCHYGVAGAEVDGLTWLRRLVGDCELLDRFLIVMPVFRGETLEGAEQSYTAGGSRNLYDHDADDALALLDGAINHFPQGDTSRIIAVGWSRGAQVALRAAARDKRISGVLALSAWTDEWSLTGQQYAFELLPQLSDGPLELKQARHAYSEKMWELKNGAASVWEMRRLMLNMSVAYSAADLPALQLHYGALDASIPIEHADSLTEWLGWHGHTDYELYVYPEGKHSPSTFYGAGPRTREMLWEYAQ